jgi:hypothetical protein
MLSSVAVPLASAIATDGLWLIGVGAFLVVTVALSTQPPRLHLQFGGLGDRRRDRLTSSIATTGLLATSAGSILVAIGDTPSAWFLAGALGTTVLIMWLLMARQLRLLWLARRGDVALRLRDNQDLAREAWELEASIILSDWRWALRHPLTSASAVGWPMAFLASRIGEPPPGVPSEWYSLQGRQLRSNKPSLVRMTADDAPGWLRDIVVVALSDGWYVLGSASFVAFYTPDGLNYETVRPDEHPIVQQLVRKALLGRLRRLGLPTHRGSRGQSLPGRDSEELVRRLVEGGQQSPAR